MNADIASQAILLQNARAMAQVGDDSGIRQFTGIVIEYVGSQRSCLLKTAANNSIASAVGDAGSEAADANFTVGSTSGTIDLTNASADTMGEVVDFINGLADYKARLIGLRRADDADTTAALVAAASVQAKVKGGYSFKIDTSVALQASCSISILDGRIASGSAEGTMGTDGDSKVAAQNFLRQVDATLTYTGTSVFEVIAVDDVANSDEVIYSTAIGSILGASTVAGSKDFTSTGRSNGLASGVGKRLIVRARAASSFVATNFNVVGSSVRLS